MSEDHWHNRDRTIQLLHACAKFESRLRDVERNLGREIGWSFSGVAAGLIRVTSLLGNTWENHEEASMLLLPELKLDEVVITVNIEREVLDKGLLHLDGQFMNPLRLGHKLYNLNFSSGPPSHQFDVVTSVSYTCHDTRDKLPPSKPIAIAIAGPIFALECTLPCETGPHIVEELVLAILRYASAPILLPRLTCRALLAVIGLEYHLDRYGLDDFGVTPTTWDIAAQSSTRPGWSDALRDSWRRAMGNHVEENLKHLAKRMHAAEGQWTNCDGEEYTSFEWLKAYTALHQINWVLENTDSASRELHLRNRRTHEPSTDNSPYVPQQR